MNKLVLTTSDTNVHIWLLQDTDINKLVSTTSDTDVNIFLQDTHIKKLVSTTGQRTVKKNNNETPRTIDLTAEALTQLSQNAGVYGHWFR